MLSPLSIGFVYSALDSTQSVPDTFPAPARLAALVARTDTEAGASQGAAVAHRHPILWQSQNIATHFFIYLFIFFFLLLLLLESNCGFASAHENEQRRKAP